MPNLNLENTLKHLDALRGTITTIEEPLRANLPPTRAVEAAKELSAIGRDHFDAYLKTFADHDDTLIIDLADRAMAYWAADAKLVDKAKQEVGERAELYVKAGFMKDRAATVLNALFPNDDADAQAADRLRDQAFTYFIHAFQRVRRHVAFLHNERGDQDIALPALSGRY